MGTRLTHLGPKENDFSPVEKRIRKFYFTCLSKEEKDKLAKE